MDDGSPTLEVGFAITPQYGELAQLQEVMNSTEARVVAEAAKIERATSGMVNLGGATAQISSFGAAATRELANVARDTNRAEKAGEAMVRQLQRQAETFGKTASEVRNMRAELRAVEAEGRGLTELAARIRGAAGEMNRLESNAKTLGGTSQLAGHHARNLAFQFQDLGVQFAAAASSSHPLKMGMMALLQQGAQIQGVMSQAGIGVGGLARQVVAMAAPFAPLIAVVGVAAGAFALFDRAVSKGIDTKSMIDGLGLTHDEIKKLKNTSVDAGDVIKATFQVMAKNVGISLDGMGKWFGQAMDWLTVAGRNTLAALYSQFVGTFRAISAIVQGVFSGKSIKEIIGDVGDAYSGAFNEANAAMTKFGQSVTAQIKSNKLADLKKQAAEIKADRTPKTDRHAESLVREAEAMEAQITNLYKLASAYGVSGAAALIAEAREKAESKAIKARADIEAAVDRQVRLSIAQRVADAAKSTAAIREQANAQQAINALVRTGLLPAERAAQLVQDQLADLPLLAALQAAQMRAAEAAARGDAKHQAELAEAVKKATATLADQRAERERLRKADEAQRFNTETATGTNRLAMLGEELRLVGATEAVRVRALATLQATQEAATKFEDPARRAAYIAQQVEIATKTQDVAAAQRDLNDALYFTADRWDLIAQNIGNAARGMSEAFGDTGRALGDLASIYAEYRANEDRASKAHKARMDAATDAAARQREEAKYALSLATAQVGAFGDAAAAAKGFFKEGSDGYRAIQKAEQAFRAVEFALSVRAMAQDAIETGSALAKSAIRAAASAREAVAKALSAAPPPLNFAMAAAVAAALAAIGVSIAGSIGGSKNTLPKANDGTGTVLGDATAKSESIKNAINALKEVDLLTNAYSRDMASSLRSIDSQIGNVASVIVRGGDINASAGVTEGFKTNTLGSLLSHVPLIGGFLSSLFGSKTSVIGSGLYAPGQSLGSILSRGFDAQTYSDVEKTKRFLGIKTGTSYSTQYGSADAGLEAQFTLILRSFNDAIMAAAGPLGESTAAIQSRLNSFVVSIGKIDLKDLTGTEIQEKLSAIFGAAADGMADAAFPGLARFQKVGEGAFETLVRVASTVEAVTNSLGQLGTRAQALGMDAKLALVDQFDDLSGLTNAVEGYFQAFYTKEEQAAAKLEQFSSVMTGLGLTMPDTIAGFRQLVEAQDLNTDAGRQAYALLLQLAPAFVDLKSSMEGAKSAADILSERQDLQRKLLELQGDTAAIRALDLAKIDASNRALQEQVWAVADAQEAAKAAQALADAWTGAGDTIMDEVRRIRGLSDTTGANTYASLLGQFNATTASARGGDLEAAKSLPQLSQALLNAAKDAATSRQELDRIRAMTAASLEATYGLVHGSPPAGTSAASLLDTAAASQAANSASSESPVATLAAELDGLRAELAQLRADNNAGHAANAAANNRTAQILDRVTQATGGDALAVELAA